MFATSVLMMLASMKAGLILVCFDKIERSFCSCFFSCKFLSSRYDCIMLATGWYDYGLLLLAIDCDLGIGF